jgi:hypothetical protein
MKARPLREPSRGPEEVTEVVMIKAGSYSGCDSLPPMEKGDKELIMSTRMALTLVCWLPLMLQGAQDYPAKPVR